MEVGTFMTTMMILGTMVTGMTLGTGIRTQTHFGNLRNLQALALRELWSNLRVAPPRQVRLCSHHFHLRDLFRQFRQ